MRQTTVNIPKQEPLRVTVEAVKHFSSLSQFHGIPDESLIRLAKRRTGLHVPDRWVAISLLRSNLGPIPVANLKERPPKQERETAVTPPPPKLILIKGRKQCPTKQSSFHR